MHLHRFHLIRGSHRAAMGLPEGRFECLREKTLLLTRDSFTCTRGALFAFSGDFKGSVNSTRSFVAETGSLSCDTA